MTIGERTAPARHQSLWAVVHWSHALLGPAEQRLFNRLSVFAAGFSLEAASAVCGRALEAPAGRPRNARGGPGDVRPEDHFGFVARQIGSFKSGAFVALLTGASNSPIELSLFTADVTVREV